MAAVLLAAAAFGLTALVRREMPKVAPLIRRIGIAVGAMLTLAAGVVSMMRAGPAVQRVDAFLGRAPLAQISCKG